MNILIADDEYLARASIKSMLMELDMDIHIVGEARDGEELVREVLKTRPDLVYVDIKMPKMNGLSAIKDVKEQCKNTEWIIITGFPVFEFAKESIELQVKKYLLKPVSKDELKKSIEYSSASKIERQQKLNLEFEHDVSALINQYMTLDDLSGNNIILSYHFIGAVLLLDSEDEARFVKLQHGLRIALSDLKRSFIDPEVRITFIPISGSNFLAVFAWNASKAGNCKNKADCFIRQLINASKQISTCNDFDTVLYGNECGSFRQLSDEISQMQKLIPLKAEFLYRNSVNLKVLMARYEHSSPQFLKISDLIYQIADSYRIGSYYESMKGIEQLRLYSSANHLESHALIPFLGFMERSYGMKLSLNNSAESLFEELKNLAEDRLNQNIPTGDTVDKTIAFINNCYMKDIGIAQIANQLHVTPNYLSALFHKKTGTNFINYLTETRMTKAREFLMSSENPRIDQISRQVGYYTVNYFTKLYKKYFGLSPSQDIRNQRSYAAFPAGKLE